MDYLESLEAEVVSRGDPMLIEAWEEAKEELEPNPSSVIRYRMMDWITQGTWPRERRRRLREREAATAGSALSQRDHARSRPIGARIRAERALAGLTRAQLAAATGISFDTLGRIERGIRPITLEQACWIADTLAIPLAALRPPVAGSAARESGQ